MHSPDLGSFCGCFLEVYQMIPHALAWLSPCACVVCQISKLRLRGVDRPAQSHTAHQRQSQELMHMDSRVSSWYQAWQTVGPQ